MIEEANNTPNYFEHTISDQQNNVELRLSPRATLDDIQSSLAGGKWRTVYDETMGKIKAVWEKQGEPLLNAKGVETVMRITRSVINTSTVQGKLTHEEIINIMNNFHKNLAAILMRGRYDFGIKEINDYHEIIFVTTNFTRIFLSRTEDGFGSMQLTETSKTIERIDNTGGEKKSKGWLGFAK